MRTLWVNQCEFVPADGETSAACLDLVRTRLAQWIDQIYARMGMPHVKVAYDGVALRPGSGQLLRAATQARGDYQLSTLVLEFPDGRDRTLFWRLHRRMARDRQRVQLCLRVQAEARPFALSRFNVQILAKNPLAHVREWLAALAQERAVRIDGGALSLRPTMLRESHLRDFVERVLTNPKRPLPVLVVAHDAPVERIDTGLLEVQRALLLLAQVAVLQNATAERAFAALVGPERSCAQGMRLYYPDFTLHAPAAAHPFWSFQGLTPPTFGALVRGVVGMLLNLNAARHVEGRVIRKASRALRAEPRSATRRALRGRLRTLEDELFRAWLAQQQAGAEQKELRQRFSTLESELAVARRLLAPPAAPDSGPAPAAGLLQDQFLDSLVAEVEALRADKQRDEQELARAEARIAELEAELANQKENLATLWDFTAANPDDAPAAAPTREPEFASVTEALQAAARDFADVLVVWDSAYESAAASPFPLPGKVYRAVQAIAEVGREYFQARRQGTSMGPLVQAFSRRVSFKFTNFESETTMHQFGQARVFHHAGQHRQMQRHLTFGGGDTNLCLQIYFDFDDASERVLVGYCGRHLPYARQRS